ncbi:MAG: hypothetical protein WCK49_04650 [Myxococcaceae bacterium]
MIKTLALSLLVVLSVSCGSTPIKTAPSVSDALAACQATTCSTIPDMKTACATVQTAAQSIGQASLAKQSCQNILVAAALECFAVNCATTGQAFEDCADSYDASGCP